MLVVLVEDHHHIKEANKDMYCSISETPNPMIYKFACWHALFSFYLVNEIHGYAVPAGPGGHNRPAFVLEQSDMVGVWQLSQEVSLLPISEEQTSSIDEETLENSIILKVKEDGSFCLEEENATPTKQPSAGMENDSDAPSDPSQFLEAVLRRGGSWRLNCRDLTLVVNRPDEISRDVHDTILTGKIETRSTQQMFEAAANSDDLNNGEGYNNESSSDDTKIDDSALQDIHLSISDGQVSIGKFMYPKKHASFWDAPILFQKMEIARFRLRQVLGNLNTRLQEKTKQEREAAEAQNRAPKFAPQDFYDRRFYLSSRPFDVNPVYAAEDRHYDADKAMLDVRVIPVTFFSNNTFVAVGNNKILRGKFGITAKGSRAGERDQLWFQVSLFGAGRSAPGSVYSEGQGLTHGDERGYRGTVQTYSANGVDDPASDTNEGGTGNEKDLAKNDYGDNIDKGDMLIHVQGSYYTGLDLGVTRNPLPMGRFSLSEITKDEMEEEQSPADAAYEDDEDDDDEAFQ